MSKRKYIVEYPEKKGDLEEIYDFFARSFGPDYYTAKKNFTFLLENEPYASFDTHLMVRSEKGGVIGAFRLLKRDLLLSPVHLKAMGMSYYAIHPDYWMHGIKKLIWDFFLEKVDSEYDVSFGFGRKALDRYYQRFGYIGYSSFSILCVEFSHIPKSEDGCLFFEYDEDKRDKYISIYQDNHEHIFGTVYRDQEIWDFNVKRLKWFKMGAFYECINKDGELIGYFVIKENEILEIAGVRGEFGKILYGLKNIYGNRYSQISFHIPPSHPFFRYISHFSHSYSIRHAWEGGHIARIAPVEKYIYRMKDVFVNRIQSASLHAFKLKVNEIVFNWDGENLDLRIEGNSNNCNISIDSIEWHKLLFGILDPEDIVCFDSKVNREKHIVQVLFPHLWPQTPELDHF